MKQAEGFKGVVVFYKYVEMNFLACSHYKSVEEFLKRDDPDRLYLGHIDVEIEFTGDTTSKEVELLRRQQDKLRVNHQLSMQIIDNKIQSLLAITHKE